MAKKTAVVAIGGNALIKDQSHQTVEDQEQSLRDICPFLADMVVDGWNIVIGHGNGPQVGFILRRSEIAHRIEGMHEVPLDVCTADTQGAIGYELQQSLQNELFHRGIRTNVATIVTQVLVDSDDPAFTDPTKPIGGYWSPEEAEQKQRNFDWSMTEDAGRGWRRVVPSPFPKEIVELDTVKSLIDSGVIVIAGGGGGVPVVDTGHGEYRGVAAVVDKDHASSLLATQIQADLFLIATSVDHVYLKFGTAEETAIGRASLSELREYLEGGHFGKGSMAPKIEAVIHFLENGGKSALITSPGKIKEALDKKAGTWFYR